MMINYKRNCWSSDGGKVICLPKKDTDASDIGAMEDAYGGNELAEIRLDNFHPLFPEISIMEESDDYFVFESHDTPSGDYGFCQNFFQAFIGRSSAWKLLSVRVERGLIRFDFFRFNENGAAQDHEWLMVYSIPRTAKIKLTVSDADTDEIDSYMLYFSNELESFVVDEMIGSTLKRTCYLDGYYEIVKEHL